MTESILDNDFLDRFKGMSWVEMSYILDDEEEEAEAIAKKLQEDEAKKILDEEKKKDDLMFRCILKARKYLLDQGFYILEEGEEVEL